MEEFLQSLVSAISLGFTFGMLGTGLSLIYGTVEVVNFAHGECLMISMYTAYWLYMLLGLDPILSIPICALFLFIFGALIHIILIKPVLKAEMVTQMMVTFGLSVFLSSLAQFLWGPNFRTIHTSVLNLKWKILGISIQSGQIIIIVAASLSLSVLLWLIYKTELGLAMLAVSEDRDTALLMGINSDIIYMITWGISLALVGITGAILSGMFYTSPFVGVGFSTLSYIAVAMGGFGSISGAFISAFLVGFTQVFFAYFFPPSFKLLAVFLIYIIVLLFKPQGLFGRY